MNAPIEPTGTATWSNSPFIPIPEPTTTIPCTDAGMPIVYLDDEQPHQNHSFEASKSCHCKPRLDTADDDGTPLVYPMVVHMAFDGRYIVEQAEAINSEIKPD